MDFGETLKYLLKERNISQTKLARLLHIAPNTVNGYIQCQHEPCLMNLKMISGVLNISANELLGETPHLPMSRAECNLIDSLHRLPPDVRDAVYELILTVDEKYSNRS